MDNYDDTRRTRQFISATRARAAGHETEALLLEKRGSTLLDAKARGRHYAAAAVHWRQAACARQQADRLNDAIPPVVVGQEQ